MVIAGNLDKDSFVLRRRLASMHEVGGHEVDITMKEKHDSIEQLQAALARRNKKKQIYS